uniref:Ankyrin repeat and SOCS box protein 8 n=1 Tax=Schizaphis graminum TaxID=13262 RepID=A0A2S2NTD4_SCHGA
MAESELLKDPNAVWTVKRRIDDIKSPVVFDVDKEPKSGPSSKKKPKHFTSSHLQLTSDTQERITPIGLQKSYHGVVYQIKWMMVVALEAQERSKSEKCGSFKFKTEDPDAGKFDDLVWCYETDQPNSYEFNFLQAKHKLNKNEKKITIKDLVNLQQKEDKRPFALEKYFLSYRNEIKENYSHKGKINKLIIATNIDFDNDLKSSFVQILDDIPILDLIHKKFGNWKFKEGDFPYRKKIMEQLENTYDLIKIVKNLGECVLKDEPIKKDSTLNSYLSALESNSVIEPSGKFHSHFIKDHQDLPEEAKQLRAAFFQETFTNTRESLGFEFKISCKKTFRTCKEMLEDKEDAFWKSLEDFKFKQFERPNSDPLSPKLPSYEYKDIEKDINNFFNLLVFVVNVSQEMLDEFIKKKCSWFVGIETDYIAYEFQIKIGDALNFETKEFISTADNVSQFFDKAKQQIDRLILIGPSLVYRANIKEFGIDFKEDTLNELCKFLYNQTTKQIFNVVNQQTKLGSIKVHQILECKHVNNPYQMDNSYIFISLISLLRLQDLVITAFESETSSHLLIIECKTTEINLDKLHSQLLQVIKSNNKKKIILITQENDSLACKFKNNSSNYDRYKDERNSLTDLTNDSQKSLLKKGKFMFQGKEVSLDELINDESKLLIDGGVLYKLINNEEIKIGKELIDSKYDEDDVRYYIDRTFNRKVNTEILKNERSEFFVTDGSEINDQELNQYNVIVLISDKDEIFKEMCNKYEKKNIHWLKKEKKYFIWKQSNGNLSILRDILDANKQIIQTYKPKKITDITDRVVILTAKPGMGKSTVLHHLALKTKECKSDSSLWVIRINLIDYSTELEREKEKNIQFNELAAIKFLYRTVGFQLFQKENQKTADKMIENVLNAVIIQDGKVTLEFHGGGIQDLNLLEVRLFNNFYNRGKIVLLFDGFDEICPDYQEITVELLQALKTTKVKKLWITSRPNVKSLEDQLCVFSYSLKPLLRKQQFAFLKKFWKTKSNICELNENRSEVFFSGLLKKLPDPIDLMSIPLHVFMVAEVFKDAFKDFYDSNEQNLSEQIIEKHDLDTLYEKFINIKFHQIRFGEKQPGINTSSVDIKNIIEKQYKKCIQDHRILALYSIFNENEVEELVSPKEIKEVHGLINEIELSSEKTGIIERVVDNKPRFVHRTFAEYFVSSYFWEKFKSIEFNEFEKFIKTFIIKQLIDNDRIQISEFLQLKAKKDFESNIDFFSKQDKLKTLLTNLLDKTKMYSRTYKKDNKQSTNLLFGIIEFSMLIYKGSLDVIEHRNDQLKLLCISAEMGYIELANVLETKCNKTFLKEYLKSDKWFYSPLWLAAKNAHLDVVKILVKNFSYDTNWKDKDNYTLIVRIFQNNNFNVLRSCLKLDIIDVKLYKDKKKTEHLPLVEALYKCAPSKVIKLLIEKTDSDLVNTFKDPDDSHSVHNISILFLKYDKEIIELAIKKSIDFSQAINQLLLKFSNESLNNPMMSLTYTPCSKPFFHSDQEFLNFFERIELLLQCGIGYNCIDIQHTEHTTLKYAKQIYLIYEFLNSVHKLHLNNDEIINSSKIYLLFSDNSSEYNQKIPLLSEFLLALDFESNEKSKNNLDILSSYISKAKEEIEQFKNCFYSKTYDDDILIDYEQMFNKFSNKEEQEDQYKSLNERVKYLLKRVLELYISQDYEIDDALKEISEEEEVLKLLNIINKLKENSDDKKYKTDKILDNNMLGMKSIDTNEDLQDLILKIYDCGGITLLSTFWLKLRRVSQEKIMGILKLMFKFSDQSLRTFELLMDLDSKYKALTEAIENKNYQEIKNISKNAKPDFIKAIINGQDDKYGSPLHYAACKGHIETTKILLEYGANPNLLLSCTEEDLEFYMTGTPLHLAVLNNQLEIAKILLNHGANANVKDINERTPLQWATEKGFSEMKTLLLSVSVR